MMTKDEIKDMRMEATWMENEGRTWDDESLTLLSIMYFDGIGISEMAYALKRSEMAIIQKINVMELNTFTKKTRVRKDKSGRCKCN